MEHNWRTPPEPISPDRITQTLTADVVILGGGQAGTCAARAAAEHGAQVIVLEKNTERRHRYNGGGQIGHINSNFLKSRGVPETDIVEFVVGHLSSQEGRIFRLRFTDGLSYEEIAKAEGISKVAVWKHLSHIITEIKKRFNPEKLWSTQTTKDACSSTCRSIPRTIPTKRWSR